MTAMMLPWLKFALSPAFSRVLGFYIL